MGLHFNGLIFVDVETSGLDETKHQIIQLAAIHGPTKDEFECKVIFDESEAEPKALEVNHYTKTAWEDAITEAEMVKQFSEFCRNHTSIEKISRAGNPWTTSALSGYNIDFDIRFIKEAFKRQDMFMPFEPRVYDVYKLAMWLYPGRNSYKLSDIAKLIGVYDENAHDAMADVRMTMAVAIEMMRKLAIVGVPIPSWAKLPKQRQEERGNDERRDEK